MSHSRIRRLTFFQTGRNVLAGPTGQGSEQRQILAAVGVVQRKVRVRQDGL